MKKLSLLLVAALLSACATTPKSIEEMRGKRDQESTWTQEIIKIIRYPFTPTDRAAVIKRPLQDVYRDISKNAERCLNVEVSRTTFGLNGSIVNTVKYHPSTRMISDSSAEMVLQLEKEARPPMPEGGYYIVLANIETVTAGETRLTVTGDSWDYENIREAIFAWARGEQPPCPELS